MTNEFKIEDGTEVGEAVGMAVGYGSMCWIGGTGDAEFDSVRASQCVEELTDAIVNGRLRVKGVGLVPKPSRWQPLGPDGRPLPTVEARHPGEVDGG